MNSYCLAIPMYNCNHLGVPVIKEALNQLNMPIVVIDDGSEVPVAESLQDPVFRFFNKRDRLKLIRHSENRGKGAAIQSALRHCAEQGYSHLLTVDGDGQHLISEVSKLIEASIRNPKDFIVGARIFDETVLEAQSLADITPMNGSQDRRARRSVTLRVV